ncbi:MAG: EF-hand domain-containing protein [Magnetospirillum sp. WYHS-4]
MMQGIGGYGAPDASQIRNLFSRIDTDGDGKVTRDEFVSGAPDADSSEKAGQLFDTLDPQGTGALTENDLLGAFQQMHSQMQAALIQQQEDKGPPDPSRFFDSLDDDGDGDVSREEFVAGRPEGVSEEDANAFFDELDAEGTGSLTKEQFTEAMKDAAPPPMAGGPPPGGASGGRDDEDSQASAFFDDLDTNQDGVVSLSEWLAGQPPELGEEEATAMFEEMDGEGSGALTKEQFVAGMAAGRSDGGAGTEDGAPSLDNRLIAMLLEAVKSYEKSGLAGLANTTTSVAA